MKYSIDRRGKVHVQGMEDSKVVHEIMWEESEVGDYIDFEKVDGEYIENYKLGLTE